MTSWFLENSQTHLGFCVELLAGQLSNFGRSPLIRAIEAYRRFDLSQLPTVSAPAPPVRRIPRLNAGQLDRLVERYESGAQVKDLATEFGIDRRTISHHLRQHGVSVPGLRNWLEQRPGDGSLGPRRKNRPKLISFLRLSYADELDVVISGRAPSPVGDRDALEEATSYRLSQEPLTAEQLDGYLEKLIDHNMSDAQVALANRILDARGLPAARPTS